MRLIDADKFLGYLIFSKHIDSLKCNEVKEAVEKCRVNALDDIRAEISQKIKLCSDKKMSYGMEVALAIIDKHTRGDAE